MPRSSSGLGRLVLNQQITGSNPVRGTREAEHSSLHGHKVNLFYFMKLMFLLEALE